MTNKRALSPANNQTIEHERQEPTFYAMIPKMAIMDLDPYELALYCNYKQTTGEKGKCTKTNATICRETRMSVNKMKAARAALEAKGYIRVVHHFDETDPEKKFENAPPTIIVRDIWVINHQLFSVSLYEGVSFSDTPPSPHDTGGSRGDTKEEPYKKNHTKESSARKRAPRKPFQPSDEARSIIDAWKAKLPAPPATDVYKNKTICGIAQAIHVAGHTPDDVQRYMTTQYATAFWKDKYMKLEHVAENMPTWKASQQKATTENTRNMGHLDGIMKATLERQVVKP